MLQQLVMMTHRCEAVLEHHHQQAEDELAGGVAKAPQRAQQRGAPVAAQRGRHCGGR